MSAKKKVCFLTPGHLSSTPRLVKAAQSLKAHGYEVHIYAGCYMEELKQRDLALAKRHAWTLFHVNGKAGFGSKCFGLLEQVLRTLVVLRVPLPLALLAFADSRWSYLLYRATRTLKADMIIGHCFGSLYPTIVRGQSVGATTGFDAEDYHPGEFLPNSLQQKARIKIRRKLEQYFYPKLDLRTTAAPLITESYQSDYGIEFQTLLNVFPLSEAGPKPKNTHATPVKYFWFSQVIGPGRGIEEFLQIMPKLDYDSELHLLGFKVENFVETISRTMQALELENRVIFHEHMPGEDLIAFSAQFDIGLCLEHPSPPHHAICLANKIFSYLLAGLPVVMSQTPAHENFVAKHPDCCVLVDITNSPTAAQRLNEVFIDAETRSRMKLSAWELAQSKYNWDNEQQLFLTSVARCLSTQ